MAGEKACSRLKSLSALAIAVCMTAVFSVFSISKTVSAAPLSPEAELQRFGVQGAVVCSTYGHNPNGFMARANDRVYIVDLKNNRIASIENPDAVFKDLDKDNSKKKGLFITQFLIQNDSYDKDHHYGEWRGSHHLIPMYILINYDKNGSRQTGSSAAKESPQVTITETSWNRKTSSWQGSWSARYCLLYKKEDSSGK